MGMRKLASSKAVIAALGIAMLSACHSFQAPMEQPIVHLSDLRLRDVQLFEQRYTLALRVENPNPRELPIDGLSYRVLLNNVELGRGASRQSVTIAPYGKRIIEVDLVSNVFSLMQRVKDMVSGAAKGVNVSITGNMSVANQPSPMPFSFQGEFGGGRT